MALIETEEAAGRLARVIASDIQLYNKQKIETGADLTAEVEEGYRLFRARVAPSLLPVFETVLTDKGLLGGKTPAPARISPLVAASAPPAPRYDAPTEPSAPAEAASAPEPPAASAPEPDLPAVVPPQETPHFEAFAAPASDGPLPPAEEPSATEERPTFEGARRLARVIISDIRIYNPKKIENGEDLTREIEEGRTLFKTRIGADLLPLFESVLEESGLVKPASKPAPAPAPVRRATPAAVAPVAPAPVAAAPVAAAPMAAPPAQAAAARPLRAPTPFPFDEPTQALEDHPTYGTSQPAPPRAPTPVPAAEAASALSRVETPFPGMDVAPLRTPTPFLEGPIMRATNTPGPARRGLPPPIPAAARTLKPVPLPSSATPPPAALTPPPEPVSPLAAAPAPLPSARFPMPGAPDAAPIAVTTSHRRKPPLRLAAAAAAIATALGLAYLFFSM